MIDPPELRVYETTLQVRHAGGRANPYTVLEGRAVPFGEFAPIAGVYLEQHAPGSFAKTTRAGAGQKAPLMLWHDNQRFPIGHAEMWRNDDAGLDGVWHLNETEDAQMAAALVESHDLPGLSVGFVAVRSHIDPADDWNPALGPDHMDRVTRLENRLVEVSLTPTPAFTGAMSTLVRTAGLGRAQAPSELDAWRLELERLRSAP